MNNINYQNMIYPDICIFQCINIVKNVQDYYLMKQCFIQKNTIKIVVIGTYILIHVFFY